MIWQLFFCLNPTWAGCAYVETRDFPTEDACYRALKEIRSSGDKSFVAYCRPKKEEPR